MTYSLIIPGKPRTKGNSARIFKKGRRRFVMPSAAAVSAEKSARDYVAIQWTRPPLEGALQVDVSFVFALPKKKNGCEVGDPCLKKVDRGNLLKLVEDAMNGIAYKDDSQIVAGDVSKWWGVQDQTEVTITVL